MSPSLLNEFRFGVSRETDRRGPPPGAPSVKDFGVAAIAPTSEPAIESISVSSYFSTGGNFPRVGFASVDTMRYARGRNTLNFGGAIERSRVNELSGTTQGGSFSFTGDITGRREREQISRINA
jgi:hypothetical protein